VALYLFAAIQQHEEQQQQAQHTINPPASPTQSGTGSDVAETVVWDADDYQRAVLTQTVSVTTSTAETVTLDDLQDYDADRDLSV